MSNLTNDPAVVAALVTFSGVVLNIIVSDWIIARGFSRNRERAEKERQTSQEIATRKLAEYRALADKELATLRNDLATQAARELEAYRLQILHRNESRDVRQKSLWTIVSMLADCEAAARRLCDLPAIVQGEGRIRIVAEVLQAMSPYFDFIAKRDPIRLLTNDDRLKIGSIQDTIVQMLLLLDLDRTDPGYRAALVSAQETLELVIREFESYVQQMGQEPFGFAEHQKTIILSS